jgi:GNAT superfamily N-acetyltransferase
MEFTLRRAVLADVPALAALIDVSVRELQAHDYTPAQIEESLKSVYGVDTQLIADGTYFVVETTAGDPLVVGCGGWSRRKTLYGGDQFRAREDSLLDPRSDAARIRAFFVHPGWARRGIGALILQACESAAVAAGFSRLEMGATLTGVPFYLAKGHSTVENLNVSMPSGELLPIVRMCKTVGESE